MPYTCPCVTTQQSPKQEKFLGKKIEIKKITGIFKHMFFKMHHLLKNILNRALFLINPNKHDMKLIVANRTILQGDTSKSWTAGNHSPELPFPINPCTIVVSMNCEGQ